MNQKNYVANPLETLSEGWAQPRGSKKFHYFRDTRSLCGRYGFYLAPFDPEDQKANASPDDCAECRRRRDKELAKEQGSGKQ